MRYARNIPIAIAGVLVLLVIIGIIAIKSLDMNRYRKTIAEQLKAATGREVTIEGDLNLNISFSPAITVDNVRFANAPWGSSPDMFGVKHFEARVALLPLFRRDIKIIQIVLIEPDILLETDADGSGNWMFHPTIPSPDKEKQKTADQPSSLPVVQDVKIEKGTLRYRDAVSGKETVFLLHTLSFRSKSLQDPLRLKMNADYNGHDFLLSGELGGISQFLEGQPIPVSLDIETGGRKIAMGGDLSAAGEDNYALDNFNAQIGRSNLAGRMDLNLKNERPELKTTLSSQLINLEDFLPPQEPPEKSAKTPSSSRKKEKIFSPAPLDLSVFKAMDAMLNFQCEELVVKKFSLKQLGLTARLENGNLRLQPFSAATCGGRLTSKINIGAAGKIVKASFTMSGDGISLGSLLRGLGLTDLVEDGKVNLDVRLNGAGSTIREIMASMNGKALVTAAKARINNSAVDYAGADLVTKLFQDINPYSRQEKQTIMQCAVLNFGVRNGIARNKTGIGMETEKMHISGGGSINFRTEQLNIAVRPRPRKGIGISAGILADMVRLRGTFANPKPAIDKLGVAKKAASVGMAISTGGISLLGQAIAGKAKADPSPCKTALGNK